MKRTTQLVVFFSLFCVLVGPANAQSVGSAELILDSVSRVDYQYADNGTQRFVLVGIDRSGYEVSISGNLTDGIAANCMELASQAMQDRLLTKEISGRERARSFRINVSDAFIGSPVYRNVRVTRCNIALAHEGGPVAQ